MEISLPILVSFTIIFLTSSLPDLTWVEYLKCYVGSNFNGIYRSRKVDGPYFETPIPDYFAPFYSWAVGGEEGVWVITYTHNYFLILSDQMMFNV